MFDTFICFIAFLFAAWGDLFRASILLGTDAMDGFCAWALLGQSSLGALNGRAINPNPKTQALSKEILKTRKALNPNP